MGRPRRHHHRLLPPVLLDLVSQPTSDVLSSSRSNSLTGLSDASPLAVVAVGVSGLTRVLAGWRARHRRDTLPPPTILLKAATHLNTASNLSMASKLRMASRPINTTERRRLRIHLPRTIATTATMRPELRDIPANRLELSSKAHLRRINSRRHTETTFTHLPRVPHLLRMASSARRYTLFSMRSC